MQKLIRLLAIGGGLVLMGTTAGCSTAVGPWVGAPPVTAVQYASPGGASAADAACSGAGAYNPREACGASWMTPR